MKIKTSGKLALILLSQLILFSLAFRYEPEDNFEWKLTFEDQFDTFDKNRWLTHHDNGGRTIWSNKELEFYKDENVVAENGVVKLIAKKESFFGKDPFGEKQFDYSSGMITNANSFVQAYGKWEMKARFPFKKGFWPAFFMVPKQRPSLPEIDVFEYFGINKDKMWLNHHWGIDYPNYS
ncbi:MAG: family 16 glycosylhydrolase, partial [Ignavibacteria bacterium]|nr:family 16 glycosylhydrolase [Ignavibacteria bacterium]